MTLEMPALEEIIFAHRLIGTREEWFPGGSDFKLCRCGFEIPLQAGIEVWEQHLAAAIHGELRRAEKAWRL